MVCSRFREIPQDYLEEIYEKAKEKQNNEIMNRISPFLSNKRNFLI